MTKKTGVKLKKAFSDPKLRIILMVLLPCMTVCLIAGILAPRLMYYMESGAVPETAFLSSRLQGEDDNIVTVSALASPIPTAQQDENGDSVLSAPKASTSPEKAVHVNIGLTSTNRDLYVRLKDDEGKLITGCRLELDFEYPSGEHLSFFSDTDGTCYLVGLEPGEYTVSLKSSNGYYSDGSTVCHVSGKVEFKAIEDISELVDVVESYEISPDEVKTSTQDGDYHAPEYLETPRDAMDDGGLLTIVTPVLDETGKQVYDVAFETGPNGYLLLSASGEESNVIPMDEDNNGVPEYGLRWIEEANGLTKGYYTAVELYGADGSPDPAYISAAVARTEVSTAMVGWQEIDGNRYYFDQFSRPVTGLKNIDGKLYYFNQFGVCADRLGIDVSFYNEGVNWWAVKAQGIDFAIIRVGGRGWETGLLYDDSCFRQNISEAKAAGIQVGVYFYSTAVDTVEAVQEASLVLERLDGISLDYPVFIDVEWSGEYPYGRADQIGKLQRTDIINAFCETISSAGYKTGVYSGQNFYRDNLEFSSLTKYMIWLASYTSFNAVPDFSGAYDIWQFTDNGYVNGISGHVDMNAVFS